MFEHEDCRTYIDHVRLLFRHIDQMVQRLKEKVNDATGSVAACEDARHLIADIADKFGAYVAEERGGGCIDEAVCRCPRLAPQEREINLQYPHVQRMIERITRMLAGCDVLGTSGREIYQEIEQLAAALSKLESDERYLLREAFGADESFSSKR
jgi:hypothetical protein